VKKGRKGNWGKVKEEKRDEDELTEMVTGPRNSSNVIAAVKPGHLWSGQS